MCAVSALSREEGSSELHFVSVDEEGHKLPMISRGKRISVKKDLISFIEDQPHMSFQIN